MGCSLKLDSFTHQYSQSTCCSACEDHGIIFHSLNFDSKYGLSICNTIISAAACFQILIYCRYTEQNTQIVCRICRFWHGGMATLKKIFSPYWSKVMIFQCQNTFYENITFIIIQNQDGIFCHSNMCPSQFPCVCKSHEPWVRGNIAASRDTVTGVAGSNLGGLVLRLGTWRAGRHYPH